MWRPFVDDNERAKVQRIIDKASALMRQQLPSVDTRMVTYQATPTDPSALDPNAVAAVVATVVKRFLSNPDGVAHMEKSLGGATKSVGYALRGDKDVRGELIITETDLEKLAAPAPVTAALVNIGVKAKLAPEYCELPDNFVAADNVAGDYPENSWLDVAP
jgi:hypothetical protein